MQKIKRVDYVFITISFITVFGLLLYFLNYFTKGNEIGSKGVDPFEMYYSNKGIVAIFTIRILLWISVAFLGTKWIIKRTINTIHLWTFLSLIFIVAIFEWVELWFGSTFYYGEVRDKQGFGVPLLSILLQVYICYKIVKENKLKRIGLIIVAIVLNFGVFSIVHKNWNLYFDYYIPWTNIPLW